MLSLADKDPERAGLGLTQAGLDRLELAARDASAVSGLTHNHYKYPARFSPKFVRAAIELLTEPGDLVADPFVGGGTTAVEALALGRGCIGVDISSLATFVSETKTLLLTDAELDAVRKWAEKAPSQIDMTGSSVFFAVGDHEGYYRNLESKRFWRIRKAVEQVLASALRLSGNAESLARCIVLRTAQWALDGRSTVPSIAEFRAMLSEAAKAGLIGATEFRRAVGPAGHELTKLFLNRSAVGIETLPEVTSAGPPRLVLTSPPYPGIHVLYHRWQVDGRKETPAPFLIANKLDGSGESYYTLGGRKNPTLPAYWTNLEAILKSTAAISGPETVFVQVVAFADPSWQLPRYLEVCEQAGLAEQLLPFRDTQDGRLWREVPNRRWYADQRGSIPASKEVVLFHKLQVTPPSRLGRSDPIRRPRDCLDSGSSAGAPEP